MCWEHKDEFLARMPRTVLQSNWYYENEFALAKIKEKHRAEVETYETLEKARYDQMPCGSTYSCRENFGKTIDHCRSVVKGDRLKGFFMAQSYAILFRWQNSSRPSRSRRCMPPPWQ